MIGGQTTEWLREIHDNDRLFKGRIDKLAEIGDELDGY
jgi:hypothetical protein